MPFYRVRLTSDMLPSDIKGIMVNNPLKILKEHLFSLLLLMRKK